MAPPVAQIDIEKTGFNETWTNRYLVDLAPSEASSGALIAAIVAAEKIIHFTGVTFTKARHRTLAANDEEYNTVILSGTGNRSMVESDVLPLFNVVRIDFLADFGRPSRKYLRACLQEGDMNFRTIDPALIAVPMQNYIDGILAQDEIVDPQGDTLLNGTVIPFVAMRQLRRGTRRRTESVL